MSTPIPTEPADPNDPVVTETPAPVPAPASAHPDPITGEPGAHPVGVGVGALGAGVAGAALGSIGGPIGMLIGAAIGAVAGGLAGKEVAATSETPAAEDVTDAAGEPGESGDASLRTPISMNSLPGEGLRVLSGAGFPGDSDSVAAGTFGLEAASAHENAPLADEAMPRSGVEAVRVSAYYHYVDRESTGESGDALSDWLAAEREIMLS